MEIIPIEQITDELVDDAADTCNNNIGYLRSILRLYFETYDELDRRKIHADMSVDL